MSACQKCSDLESSGIFQQFTQFSTDHEGGGPLYVYSIKTGLDTVAKHISGRDVSDSIQNQNVVTNGYLQSYSQLETGLGKRTEVGFVFFEFNSDTK